MDLFSKLLVHPQSGKKLQIYVDGCRIQLIRIPPDGGPATDEVAQLKTTEAALQTATRFIDAHLAKGFVDVSSATKAGALSEALNAVRTGVDVRTALAKLSRTGSRDDVRAFAEKEAAALFGALADGYEVEFLGLEFRDGFVDAVTLDGNQNPRRDLPTLTAQFLELPICRQVRKLRVAVAGITKHSANDDWTTTFAEITSAACAATLESLRFDFAWDDTIPPLDTITIGDFSTGWDKLTALKELSVRGEGMTLGGANIPTLETLRWECDALGVNDCKELAGARLPRLRRLVFPGAPLTDGEGRRLLGVLAGLPALEHLQADCSMLRPETRSALEQRLNTKPETKAHNDDGPKRRAPAKRRPKA